MVPPLWFYEVGDGLVMAHRRKRITSEQLAGFVIRLKALPIDAGAQTPVDMLGLPAIAQARGLTTYDAAYLEDETRAEHERAVVIGYGLWQRRFGARADIVGKAITLNRQVYTIVGVAAREFTGPPGFDIGGTVSNQKPELWIPLNLARKDLGTFDLTQRANRWATVMARLRPGVSLAAAQQEMNIAAGRLAQQYPESNKGWGIEVRSLGEQTTAGIRTSHRCGC